MAKNENRRFVEIQCTECKKYIRPTSKNVKNTPDRLEMKKFCPSCKKHVQSKEKK